MLDRSEEAAHPMTRKLTDQEKAARGAARRSASMRLKASRAARDGAAEAERPFNVRSTRESVCRSILKGEALTLEQYRVAETRDLVGSGITNAPVEAMPIAYDGPHQFRWDPGSWQGFVKLSASRKINNSNDTYDPDWEYRSEFDWPGSTIDDEVLADEDTLTPSYEDYLWPEDWDVYDRMDDTFGGSDLTEEGYLRWWRSQASGR